MHIFNNTHLMLGRLSGLGFEQELCRVSFIFFVLNGHAIESRHVVAFLLQIRIQQGLVPFPTTPKDVIQSSQFVIHILCICIP